MTIHQKKIPLTIGVRIGRAQIKKIMRDEKVNTGKVVGCYCLKGLDSQTFCVLSSIWFWWDFCKIQHKKNMLIYLIASESKMVWLEIWNELIRNFYNPNISLCCKGYKKEVCEFIKYVHVFMLPRTQTQDQHKKCFLKSEFLIAPWTLFLVKKVEIHYIDLLCFK